MIVCANVYLGLTLFLALTKSHQNNLTRLVEETEAQRSKKLAQLTQLKGTKVVLESRMLICSGRCCSRCLKQNKTKTKSPSGSRDCFGLRVVLFCFVFCLFGFGFGLFAFISEHKPTGED